ncbi:DUF397 domain-containing protein [Streptomyces sp. HD]|uniref:DUF397 domain-containing protein n=1 Tax=Streptomyces sp. HD TaxID=3020892 RepID=UPI00232FD00A|nr:DUF397 domain-containing protein [Streptomyces sp. HD]MDC0765640.1 DUF397 domain-containing protein [Streptomyces sp. HD]
MSSRDGTGQNCVETAHLTPAVAIRGSKNPTGPAPRSACPHGVDGIRYLRRRRREALTPGSVSRCEAVRTSPRDRSPLGDRRSPAPFRRTRPR